MTLRPMTAVVVDDEPLARRGLIHLLGSEQGIKVVADFGQPARALEYITAHHPDVVFLDIQMPGMSGLELAQQLTRPSPSLVFVTAFDGYAVRAFEHHAVDYLLKPINPERLTATVAALRVQHSSLRVQAENGRLTAAIAQLQQRIAAGSKQQSFDEVLVIKEVGRTTRLLVSMIDWVDAAGDYMCVHAQGKTHILRWTMAKLQKQLDPSVFLRVHRSALVNVNRIREIVVHANGEYRLTLVSGDVLKSSRRYKKEIRALMSAK
jgi:two-component system LytT family response regulator